MKIDPRYTSQDCSACGHRQKMELAVRRYDCPHCSLSIDRDHNAAINIQVRAGTSAESRNLHLQPRSG